MTVVVFGDSLVDTGNLTSLASFIGFVPFPDPPYEAGKASNGKVLVEAVLGQLEAAYQDQSSNPVELPTLVLGFRIDLGFGAIPPISAPNPLSSSINYAVAGSTSGFLGSAGNMLDALPIGLQTQVDIFKQDLVMAGGLGPNNPGPDAIINSGSNDIFEIFVEANIGNLRAVLNTPGQGDDNALIQDLANQIVGNLQQAVESLRSHVDDIVIFGISRVGNTPFAIETAAQLPGDFATETQAFLTAVAEEVNDQLIQIYDGNGRGKDSLCCDLPANIERLVDQGFRGLGHVFDDLIGWGSAAFGKSRFAPTFDTITDSLFGNGFLNEAKDYLTGLTRNVGNCGPCQGGGSDPAEDVLVIDGIEVFDEGLKAWIQSLPEGVPPILDFSYRDYIEGNPFNLPADLTVEQFAFVDGSHPTSDLNMFLAKEITPQILAEFPDFAV
jgi:hypothetical protein